MLWFVWHRFIILRVLFGIGFKDFRFLVLRFYLACLGFKFWDFVYRFIGMFLDFGFGFRHMFIYSFRVYFSNISRLGLGLSSSAFSILDMVFNLSWT